MDHVSVKGYKETNGNMGFCIRAQLEEKPSMLWIKVFQMTWLISPLTRKLPVDMHFTDSEIIFTMSKPDKISETIEALKATITAADRQLQSKPDQPGTDTAERSHQLRIWMMPLQVKIT